MRKLFSLVITVILISGILKAQNYSTKEKVMLQGYTQIRFTTNFNDVNSFALRRLKLWAKSAPDFDNHWGYKIQTTLTSSQNEKFFLQDAEAFYHFNNILFTVGQFVPHYSLQRFQHDFSIPLLERSVAINNLIPNGTLGVRDIGIEGNIHNSNNNIETWLGVFNGYGIKEYRFNNQGIMLTNKTNFYFLEKQLLLGYSCMYRKAEQLKIKNILPDSVLFTGNDFRYNLFVRYNIKNLQLQAEYLYANLQNKVATGYYVLTAYTIGKNQWVASWNQFNDIINSTDDLSEIHLGYNYLLNGDKLKIMLDNGIIFKKGNIENYFETIQLQLFIN